MAAPVSARTVSTPLPSRSATTSGVVSSRSSRPRLRTTTSGPCSSSSATSAGWMPGRWWVPVSFQSHARPPPGHSLASRSRPTPSTSTNPQPSSCTRGEPPSPAAMAPVLSGVMVEIVTGSALIDEILAPHEKGLGLSYLGYRNHCLRMLNIGRYLVPDEPHRDDRLAIMAAFHDLPFFLDGDLDYLGRASDWARDWLLAAGRAEWEPEIRL